jgi:NAD(P)-dependent dehydrogenase (short-subunit alcohol dehydrogenase family)
MDKRKWALILGASSGFGAATSRELARSGFNIFGVHLDKRSTMPQVEEIRSDIEAVGGEAVFFNVNAASEEKRGEVVEAIRARLVESDLRPRLKVFMHSLAFGALKRFVPVEGEEVVNSSQMGWTLDVMAHSLVYWTQDLIAAGLLGEGSRIFAMTSSGGERVLPYYGAVSAAKAALESHMRQLSVELVPLGISINAIRAGVTDTPALRKIPDSERLVEKVRSKNPGGRLTRPEDIALVIKALSTVETSWMTGNVIGVDGGEHLVD